MDEALKEAYERGLHDGEIRSLSEKVDRVHVRQDKMELRLTAQERITYAMLAIVGFIQIMPTVRAFLGA